MAKILPQILAWITRHDRYKPDAIVWKNDSWTNNVFRAWELLCWRKAGIRREVYVEFEADKHGKILSIRRRFYTFEAFFIHAEAAIRAFVKAECKRIASEVKRRKGIFDGIGRIFTPELSFAGMPAFSFGEDEMGKYLSLSIARDAGGNAHDHVGDTGLTLAVTVPSSNPICFLGGVGNGGGHVSSASINGAGLTQIGTGYSSVTNGDGRTQYASLWYKAAPSTGSQTVSVTAGGGNYTTMGGVMLYTGVLQSSPLDGSSNSSSATASSITGTITIGQSGSWAIMFVGTKDGGTSDSTNSTNTGFGPSQYGLKDNYGYGPISAGSFSMSAINNNGSTPITQVTQGFKASTSSYNQTVAATGAGSAKVLKGMSKTLASTGAGSASVKKQITKTIHAIGQGIGRVRKQMARTLTALGAGVASISASRVYMQILEAIGQGSAAISMLQAKVLSAVAVGSAKIVKRAGKTLHAIGAGHAVVEKSLMKTLRATAQAVATLTKHASHLVSMSTIGNGVATIRKAVGKILKATGVGHAVLDHGRAVIMHAVAHGTATIRKTPRKLFAVVATVVARIAKDFWRTKYPAKEDDYDIKYPHGN